MKRRTNENPEFKDDAEENLENEAFHEQIRESTCSDNSPLEYCVAPENKDVNKLNKEFLLNYKIPQESTPLSLKALESEIHHSQKCLKSKLEKAIEGHGDSSLTEDEINHTGHILHAYNCPKLAGGNCFKPFCSNPKEITNFVETNLEKKYPKNCGNAAVESKEQSHVKSIYKIIISHGLKCQNRENCNMPLCKHLEKSLEKLIPDDLSDEDNYEVLYNVNSSHNQGKQVYQHGVDFHIRHQVSIGKGAFGSVTNCWLNIDSGSNYSMALKKTNIQGENINRSLGISLPILKKLNSLPNVLAPELILRSQRHVLMFSEKAEMSLLDYMKAIGPYGLPVDATTYIIFNLVKGVNQLHSLGYTHGDVKVSNAVLVDRFRNVKLIDLDTVKEESQHQYSGTTCYDAPEVHKTKTVKKASDVYSTCRCIPVLLYGNEKILKKNHQEISDFVRSKDSPLAEVFEHGTQHCPKDRITAKELVKWFRSNTLLKQRWRGYEPKQVDLSTMPGEDLSCSILKSYMIALMDDLPKHIEM